MWVKQMITNEDVKMLEDNFSSYPLIEDECFISWVLRVTGKNSVSSKLNFTSL
jgi:hypothetical protein